MSKTLHIIPGPGSEGTDTCLQLEDEVLEALAACVQHTPGFPMAQRLCHDFYADCFFDSAEAGLLGVELATLSRNLASPPAAWLDAVAALATRAGAEGWALDVVAD